MRNEGEINPENAAAPATVTGEVAHRHWRDPGRLGDRRRKCAEIRKPGDLPA